MVRPPGCLIYASRRSVRAPRPWHTAAGVMAVYAPRPGPPQNPLTRLESVLWGMASYTTPRGLEIHEKIHYFLVFKNPPLGQINGQNTRFWTKYRFWHKIGYFDRFGQYLALWALKSAIFARKSLKSGKFRSPTSSFWRVFDPFRCGSHVHDLRCHFQYGRICHIYRALGKSKLGNVFLAIPYSRDSKIGGMDGDLRHEFLVLGEMCHPRVSEKCHF